MPSGSEAPRWQLDSVYPGYESEQYQSDRKALRRACSSLLRKIDDSVSRKQSPDRWIRNVVKKMDTAIGLYSTLEAFIYCNYSVNTKDARTVSELSSIEKDGLPLKDAQVRFRNAIRPLRRKLGKLAESSKAIDRFRFFLEEEAELANMQMPVAEENLAADLQRPGADAWGRLQGTISSNLSWPWEGEERKTVVQLRALAMDPDRGVRRKAFEKEIEAWGSMEIPLAAALNGVKGSTVILDERRKYESPLDHAAKQARISRATLDAQISTMERNLGVFRGYLKQKAKLIGEKKLAFYDLFAPVGEATRTWTFAEARDFILRQFSTFSRDLGDFAERAFRERWIDAEPREGKVGGAFCAPVPQAAESRILANFDGSFDSLFTLAHELGHGYHGHVLKDLPFIQQDYPMTLAETASIFCETIVFNRAVAEGSHDDRCTVLELFLQSSTQVIVDILSRYRFEQAVFDRRRTAELSPEEFCELMTQAQRDTYGDGLDGDALHPYMWAVKSHYYSADLSYYNFPYAFGQLFGLGLYATYREDEEGFPAKYRQLLQMTGRASANDVASSVGFNIEDPGFWQGGIDVIAARAAEFASLVEERTTGQ